MRKHKKIISAVAFMIVVCLTNSFLNFAVVQSGLTRIVVHELNHCDDYKCVVLGQSHSSYGISTEKLGETLGLKTMNMSIGGQYMLDMYYYVQEVFANNSPKVIVLDLDYQYFINIPKERNTVMSTLMYYEYPLSMRKLSYALAKLSDKEYRATFFPWMNHRNDFDIMRPIVMNKLSKDYRNYSAKSVTQIDPNDTYKGGGFIYRNRTKSDKKGNKVGIWWNEEKVDYTESVKYFKKIVNLCRKNNAQVVMISSPINAGTLLNPKEEYYQIEQYMKALADDNNLTYYNFNIVKPEVFDRTDNDYWDYDGHMYGDSAERYSIFLGNFLKKVTDGETINMNDYFYTSVYELDQAINSKDNP